MRIVADERVLFESPDPAGVYAYTPALCHGFGGRIVAGVDLGGPGTAKLEGPAGAPVEHASGNQLRLFVSDDRGDSWRETGRLPLMHEMLFRAGGALDALGHAGPLGISRSDDNGESWSPVAVLDGDHRWHQSACRVDHHRGRVYLVYERIVPGAPWPGARQVFLSAPEDADLRRRDNWTFSEPFDALSLFKSFRASCHLPDDEIGGLLEANVVPYRDSGLPGYDPDGRAWLLFCRAQTGLGHLAGVLRGVEDADGALRIEPCPNRSTGLPLFLVPFPGGSLKFHLDWDDVSGLFWLVASESDHFMGPFDAMLRPERRHLGLWFGRTGFDWHFAGRIASGPTENGARSYAQLLIDGDDLLIASRSGDGRAKSSHDNNLALLHRVRNFRRLAEPD